MRYHFFLHYGWFFQNLGKEGRRTLMHTTVNSLLIMQIVFFHLGFFGVFFTFGIHFY